MGVGLSCRACSERTRGNGPNLRHGGFRLDIRKKMITISVVRDWKRLCREVTIAAGVYEASGCSDVPE